MRETLFGAAVIACALSTAAAAGECAPPKGFVDTPHPVPAPVGQLVSHSEDIDIDRPLAEVLHVLRSVPLQKTVRSSGSLPSVFGTHALTKEAFGAVGTRQLDCLTDGSTLEEEVLVSEDTPTSSRFRYVVWNYTSDQAKAISYAVGEFDYAAVSATRTHIHWTYSFALNRSRFPGWLGWLGDFLFRVTFLDRDYADLMRNTMAGMKTRAEAAR